MIRRVATDNMKGSGAILSRLLVVLALVLFGAPPSQADGVANAGPVADRSVEPSQGILTVPRHLVSAQLPDDYSPNMVEPCAAVQMAHIFPAGLLPAPLPTFVPVAIRILPAVRAPPVI